MNYIKRTKEAFKKSHYYWKQVMKTSRPRALYIGGWLNNDNLGDEALYAAYKELFPRLEFVHYPSAGGRVLVFPNKIIRPLRSGFLAGGTLINSGMSFINSMKECDDFLEDIYVFGTGVRNPGFWSKQEGWESDLKDWAPMLKSSKYVGVRGPMSLEILQQNGIDNAEVIGDPVLSLAADSLPVLSGDTKEIGINIGSDGIIWGDEDKVIECFGSLAKMLKGAGWTVRWHVVYPGDMEKTVRCAGISGTEEHIQTYYSDHESYLRSVEKLTVFLGMRLHSVILAVCRFVPSIMIEYRPKCRDFMASIEQESLCFRSDEIDVNEMYDQIELLAKDRVSKSESLFEVVSMLKKRQKAKAQEIQAELIDSQV